jgi:phosphoribosyl-ATP pyrophosphohydrolase
MKSFEDLFAELREKAARKDPGSGTVRQLQSGIHAIGKKVIEEACEVWMAAEHEGRDRTAREISQLLYHLQVMMIACDLDLEDIYRHL